MNRLRCELHVHVRIKQPHTSMCKWQYESLIFFRIQYSVYAYSCVHVHVSAMPWGVLCIVRTGRQLTSGVLHYNSIQCSCLHTRTSLKLVSYYPLEVVSLSAFTWKWFSLNPNFQSSLSTTYMYNWGLSLTHKQKQCTFCSSFLMSEYQRCSVTLLGNGK